MNARVQEEKISFKDMIPKSFKHQELELPHHHHPTYAVRFSLVVIALSFALPYLFHISLLRHHIPYEIEIMLYSYVCCVVHASCILRAAACCVVRRASRLRADLVRSRPFFPFHQPFLLCKELSSKFVCCSSV